MNYDLPRNLKPIVWFTVPHPQLPNTELPNPLPPPLTNEEDLTHHYHQIVKKNSRSEKSVVNTHFVRYLGPIIIEKSFQVLFLQRF